MSSYNNVCVVVPAYNEGEVIERTLNELLQVFSYVICVNDGSIDNTVSVVSRTKAIIVNHSVNLGQGGALQTGVELGLENKSIKYFLTFDSDGQHSIEDAKKMIDILKDDKVDVVLGSRFLGGTMNMSVLKRLVLKAAIIFSNVTTGLSLTDTHNGLRVFNRKTAEIMDIKLSGMAHASEILHIISENKLKYKEVPVTINYTDYSKAKGQSVLNSINIVMDLIMRKVK